MRVQAQGSHTTLNLCVIVLGTDQEPAAFRGGVCSEEKISEPAQHHAQNQEGSAAAQDAGPPLILLHYIQTARTRCSIVRPVCALVSRSDSDTIPW